MATLQFREALDQLLQAAATTTVAALCAEVGPVRCHRLRYHPLSPFTRIAGGFVAYPTLLDEGE